MAAFAALVFLYVMMGLAETEAVQENIARLKDQNLARQLLAAGRGIGEKFRSYLFVRTIASIATGLAIWGFVAYMRLDLAGAWGVLGFALNFLPYIGSILVTVLLPLFALIQADTPATAVYVLLGVSLIQFVTGSLLEPIFSGSALSISPPVVIFSVVLWTLLWGALGAFLGVPLTIAALTLLEQFPSARWLSDLLAGAPGMNKSRAKHLQMDQSHINDWNEVLMLSVRLRNRAVPVAWRVRATQGNIGFFVQKELSTACAPFCPKRFRHARRRQIIWNGEAHQLVSKGRLVLSHSPQGQSYAQTRGRRAFERRRRCAFAEGRLGRRALRQRRCDQHRRAA